MTAQHEGYARPELLAETEWLQQHLGDPRLRIVDCESHDAYGRAHLPGAVGLPVHHYLKNANDSVHVIPPDQHAALMGELGIANDTLVVAYDAGGVTAARFWWVMNYYGHTKVKVLNGGWPKWQSEGRPMTSRTPVVAKTTFVPHVQAPLLCTLEQGKRAVGDADIILWDVRSDAEWTGENPRGNQRSGHIPGAVHLEWSKLMTEGEVRVFRSAPEMRALLSAAGVTPGKAVVTY